MATAEQLEAELRAVWTAWGVSRERQEAILADLTAKAQPGARIGPFIIGKPGQTGEGGTTPCN